MDLSSISELIGRFKIFLGYQRLRILAAKGLKIGKDCSISGSVIIDEGHCWHIEIGNNVTLASRVHILAHDASTKKHLGFTRIGKVKICDNVFIGAGSIILPNVIIGPNSIIGAGSVVTRNIPKNSVAAGNPAKVLYSLESFLNKHEKQMARSPCFGEEYTFRKNIICESIKNEMNEKMIDGCGYLK